MPRLLCRLTLCLIAAFVVAHACHAQTDDKKPRKEPWESFVDTPEVKAYLEQLKTGAVDGPGRAAVVTKVLPLLEDPANRRSIERLRRRIREGLLSERMADAPTLEALNRDVASWAAERTKAKGVDPAVAVNAMLLVGDLRGKDGKPWPGGGSMLAAAAADQALPLAARVAAMAALARHAEAGAPLTSEAAVILKVATTAPVAGSGRAGEWLAARAIGLLPAAMPEASPEAAGELTKVLGDASRPVDVRVRAAEALGRMATAAAKIDASRTLEAIRATAIRGLEEDLEAATEEEFGRSLAAGGAAAAGFAGGGEFGSPPGGGFGMRPDLGGPVGQRPGATEPAPPVEPTVLERDAWRLAALANAIQPVGKGTGVVGVAGDATGAAKDFATLLRENASILHEWVHPPAEDDGKKPGAGRKPAVTGEFAFPGGGETGADAKPTKQELGQALRDALADLQASPRFNAAPAAPAQSDPEPDPKAPAANDPFTAP
jgi:hypothetical protein